MMPSANALKGEPSQSEERSPVEMSPTIQKYFSRIESEVKKAYAVAQEARARGFDPEKEVSIPLAKDLAERVEGLVSVAHPPVLGSGLARRILDLEEQYGKLSWKVALHIALDTAQGHGGGHPRRSGVSDARRGGLSAGRVRRAEAQEAPRRWQGIFLPHVLRANSIRRWHCGFSLRCRC